MSIPMSEKKLMEARTAMIPDQIIGKMAQGHELNERERIIVRGKGKVYVESHRKDGKWVKPQLRDLPRGNKSNPGNVKGVRYSNKKSRMKLAEEILEFAKEEAELGFFEDDYKRIRDSAEKAYLSVVTATDYAMEQHRSLPDPGPMAHDQRRKFLRDVGRRDLEKEYSYFSDSIHGGCFYRGECPNTNKKMKIIFDEVEQYIREMKEGI